jgi:dihydroflavonol-4-reductase
LKALVTGGTGFIGSHVVRLLLAEGEQVRVLHLPGENAINLGGLDVELVPGDVTDRASVRNAVRGCDRVFHLAAIFALWTRHPERMRQVNVGGTEIVLREAGDAGASRIVATSSIAVFGGQGRGRDADERSPFRLGNTRDPYARTKYEAHRIATDLAASGLDVVIVAPTGPVGPGDVGPTPTGRLLLSALTSPWLAVIDTESNVVDVRDVARGHLLAARLGRRGETYLVGGQNLTLRELVTMVRVELGLAARAAPGAGIVAVPPSLLAPAAHALVLRARLTGRPPLFTPQALAIAALGLRASCAKAARELGLRTGPIRGAVRDAIVWFERNGYVRSSRLRRRIRDRLSP